MSFDVDNLKAKLKFGFFFKKLKKKSITNQVPTRDLDYLLLFYEGDQRLMSQKAQFDLELDRAMSTHFHLYSIDSISYKGVYVQT